MNNQIGVQRLPHLDFLRASMMFLGVLVHASHADYGSGVFEEIRFTSSSFRMGCFFIISGLFSVMLLNRSQGSVLSFLYKRSAMVTIPALFAVIFLVPYTNHLMSEYFSAHGHHYVSSWMAHTWFLFVLLVFTLSLPALTRTYLLLEAKTSPYAPSWLSRGLLFTIVVIGCMVAKKILFKFQYTLPMYDVWGFIATSSLTYLPYFLLGVMMYLHKEIFEISHKFSVSWGGLSIIFVTIKYILWQTPIATTTQHFISMTVDYITTIAISGALFSITYKLMTKENRMIRLLSESAYTVYIIHYILIAVVITQLQVYSLHPAVLMSIAFLVASTTGVAVHTALVKPFPLATLLLNGKLPRIKAQAARGLL